MEREEGDWGILFFALGVVFRQAHLGACTRLDMALSYVSLPFDTYSPFDFHVGK